ncbi:very short patch repair endonuclease [Streptomyces albidoflavus]|nr:very short patch repair endonuclease [Streptomyces albidoflavus]
MARDSAPPAGSWTRTEAGSHLRGRRSRDTRPEGALRHAVHRLGLRYRLQRRVAPRCTADFVLPPHHVAVFVDGCFRHGCPVHGPKALRGPNASLWTAKIETNRARDLRNTEAATDAGWSVVRIWECEVRSSVSAEQAALRVAAACPSEPD